MFDIIISNNWHDNDFHSHIFKSNPLTNYFLLFWVLSIKFILSSFKLWSWDLNCEELNIYVDGLNIKGCFSSS